MQKTNIAVFCEAGTTPVPLVDRFGDIMDEDMDQHWIGLKKGAPAREALELLISRYGDKYPELSQEFTLGDPRRFQTEEISFIAFFDGRVGVHVEFELDFGLSEADQWEEGSNTDYVPTAEFERRLQYWSARLEGLPSEYRHTSFFLTYGKETYDGRVCLNAFTPLNIGVLGNGARLASDNDLFAVSPYHEDQPEPDHRVCPTLYKIANRLIDIGLNDKAKAA